MSSFSDKKISIIIATSFLTLPVLLLSKLFGGMIRVTQYESSLTLT